MAENIKDKIIIRDATKIDMEAVHALVVALAVFEKEPDAVKITADYYRAAFLEGKFESAVAELDGEIVGMIIFYNSFSTWRGRKLYLEDFVVKKEFRNYGIGQLLFNEYLRKAKERDCTMVKWEVIDWNKSAIKFYEKNNATIETRWWNGKIIFDELL